MFHLYKLRIINATVESVLVFVHLYLQKRPYDPATHLDKRLIETT